MTAPEPGAAGHALAVAFYRPLIPPNTGNAIRMVACTGAHLHLVGPLGFTLDDARLRRAGLDYHDLAAVTVHDDLEALWSVVPGRRVLAFTTAATTSFAEVRYRPDDVLLLGPEPDGLPADVLAAPEVGVQVRIPMLPGRRSLNLSNAAAVATYEAWRQLGYPGVANGTTRMVD